MFSPELLHLSASTRQVPHTQSSRGSFMRILRVLFDFPPKKSRTSRIHLSCGQGIRAVGACCVEDDLIRVQKPFLPSAGFAGLGKSLAPAHTHYLFFLDSELAVAPAVMKPRQPRERVQVCRGWCCTEWGVVKKQPRRKETWK